MNEKMLAVLTERAAEAEHGFRGLRLMLAAETLSIYSFESVCSLILSC